MRASPRWVALALLALAGCRTLPPPQQALAPDDPRPAERVAALRALASERSSLRATARSRSEGPEGGGFANQLLLVEKPARLRVEVIGLLQQRVLVLATDGERYELYRAEGAQWEEGPVHPGVLDEVAGLPVTPEAAVGLLLAAPDVPEAPASAAFENGAGEISLSWPDRTLVFDAAGRLTSLHFHPEQRDVLLARWSDWRPVAQASFPHRFELDLPEVESRLVMEYKQVELGPVLAPELFRLRLGTR